MSGQFDAPAALSPAKEPVVPIARGVCLGPEPVWTFWRRYKSFAPAKTPNMVFRTSNPSVVRTPTAISQLHVFQFQGFFFNNQPDALIIPILFCYKTLHVSGIFSAHHQEFSTIHSTLVSFMQVSDEPFPSRVRMELHGVVP